MLRIGQGYDSHRLVADKPLMIGGVKIDSPVGSEAHSDGDVLLHALIDALLGAAGLGDIGEHFPPSDDRYKDADSSVLLAHVLTLIATKNLGVVNVDSTVFLEKIKLKPYKADIRQNIARLLRVDEDRVSVKAKTAEGMDAVGEGKAIEASVTVLLAIQEN
ncbi:MAG: 2-C-methyl-D-erythritol 2,4-cyclodiphosphate synthase [Vampirovibrio sp.]|nr:2-C-methyl-D-erythritol 2,4-cyclodiphosphate synthase [Vampirovibrio sp.]